VTIHRCGTSAGTRISMWNICSSTQNVWGEQSKSHHVWSTPSSLWKSLDITQKWLLFV